MEAVLVSGIVLVVVALTPVFSVTFFVKSASVMVAGSSDVTTTSAVAVTFVPVGCGISASVSVCWVAPAFGTGVSVDAVRAGSFVVANSTALVAVLSLREGGVPTAVIALSFDGSGRATGGTGIADVLEE